ncbi:hypothetical protein Ocin01_18822, partial [Orchesella cincta]
DEDLSTMFAKVIKAIFVVSMLALVGMAAQNEVIRNRLIDVVVGLPKAPMMAFGMCAIVGFLFYKRDQKEEKECSKSGNLLIRDAERNAAAFRAERKLKEDLDTSLVSEED